MHLKAAVDELHAGLAILLPQWGHHLVERIAPLDPAGTVNRKRELINQVVGVELQLCRPIVAHDAANLFFEECTCTERLHVPYSIDRRHRRGEIGAHLARARR